MQIEVDELDRRLANERIVTLTADDWAATAHRYEVVERHDTWLAGDLVIIRTSEGFAAVESPPGSERVIRRLADRDAVHEFVQRRLAEYERMWDGCGCRIDYFS